MKDPFVLPSLPSRIIGVDINDVDFHVQDVMDILGNLNIQKSPGPDTIHPAVQRECRDELANPLYNLFKASLIRGKIPFDRKTGHISPIF